MNRNTLSRNLVLVGLVLLAAAAALTGFNLWSQQQGEARAAAALEVLQTARAQAEPQPEEAIPDYVLDPTREMPQLEADGLDYIGWLEIPALELTLPVLAETTMEQLKTAPCRYAGTAYQDDLVIGAHNYARHFGSIGELSQGDRVTFTDLAGNLFEYEVADFEVLQPDQGADLCSGEWPLTLYTCTLSGQTRMTVRCAKLAG